MDERTSPQRLGIAAVALSILWLFGLGSVFGIILGGIARTKADTDQDRLIAHAALGIGVLGLVIVLVLITANR